MHTETNDLIGQLTMYLCMCLIYTVFKLQRSLGLTIITPSMKDPTFDWSSMTNMQFSGMFN